MNNWKRTLALIWGGQSISLLTSLIVGHAAVFWLSVETRSPEILAWSVLAACLPQAVLGLFIGVYIDRWNRKRIMIFADLFIAACTLVMCLLLWSGSRQMEYFYILFACRSIGSAFHTPAFQASIPLLVPESELTRISGINQSIQSACGIIAPMIGASLIAFWKIENILLLDVFGALIGSLSLIFLTIPEPERKNTEHNLGRELRESFSAVRSKEGLPFLFICFILVTFAIMPASVLFPLITVNHFGGDSFQMGLIEMIWGVGALIGGVAIASKQIKINDVKLINLTYVILGIYLIATGLLPSNGFIAFASMTVLGGVTFSVVYGLFTVIIQRNIPPDVLGRVFSLLFSLAMLPSIVGIGASGFLAETLGITTVFILGGVMILVIGVYSLFVRKIRKL